jgi:hypothetical protein
MPQATHQVCFVRALKLWRGNLKEGVMALRKMFPSGIEPETFCVLGRCDNRYTTETCIIPSATLKIGNSGDQKKPYTPPPRISGQQHCQKGEREE